MTLFLLLAGCLCMATARAADWLQFRGPDGSGIASNAQPPLKWSDTENLKWRTELPGPGSSSPIVSGQRVFVTCWSGYGNGRVASRDDKLQRRLVCLGRAGGNVLWSKSVPAEAQPSSYVGFMQEHGYATQTPATDGERIYIYFGKGGALAFDLDGRQLWQVSLGTDANEKNWGSAASPVLYKDPVIINALEESHAISALDKYSGKQLWKSEAASLAYVFGTPTLATHNGRTELVIAVLDEIWGLNPENGKTRWYAESGLSGNVVPSVVAGGDTVFAFGGFPRLGAVAVQLGGREDVTKTHVVWSANNSTYVPTPVLHEGRLYFASDAGFATCLDAGSGELIFKERLPGASASGRGKPFYASAVLANGHVYAVSRWNGVFVFAAKPEFQLVGQNKFVSDETQFNATPAMADNQIFLRSDRYLYCLSSGS